MPTRGRAFDVVIVGAGPAGCAAAIAAQRSGLRALLIDLAEFPRGRRCGGWIGPAGVALCRELGLTAKAAAAAEFEGVRLHSWDLRRNVDVGGDELRGWIVDREKFDHALLSAARSAGAQVRMPAAPTALRLGENAAVIACAGAPELTARVVLIADGADSPTARLAQLGHVRRTESFVRCAQASYEGASKRPSLEVILGGGRGAALGVIVRAPRQALVSMITRDLSASVEEQFGALLTACERTGVLTGRAVGPPESRPCVAGLAVDMDTHVGKRCLLIGDAGGFVASFSGEGIYPAMKSGWIAGQVAARAVAAPVMQDELSSFSAAWRAELADYLRMPNIDLTLLVPLIFTNPQMSRRVARAFLLGRSF